ncbi:hypothetical protein [Symbiopectobacterium sp.]|uniref:hypothetical protein n=1 Tax=Symbiopectobacterium sp. TaxID=2952789 RepID=UPI003F2D7859
MWRAADIRFPADTAAINCAVVPVHPWVYGAGQKTTTGSYLSPANALAYLAPRIQAAQGDNQVVVMMVCAAAHADFMQRLAALMAVFPLPDLTQVARMAQAAADLETVKMQLPAKGQSLPAAIRLSVATNRQAINAQRIASAQAQAAVFSSVDAIKSQLASFAAERGNLLEKISLGLNALQQASARVWVFSAKGQGSVIAAEMVKDIPQPSTVYTAAVMFVGKSLNALEGMIHEPDYYARPRW